MHQTFFLPLIGLVDAENLRTGHLFAVEKSFYVILETLPQMYGSGVPAMEVDERPMDEYSDIGGLDKQIEEPYKVIILPLAHKEKFPNLGISPLNGVILYGPPKTGKTFLVRACAAQTKSTFPKLECPQPAQMFIGDGGEMVRDALTLAKKAPAITCTCELDPIGTKRFDSEWNGYGEVHSTMLHLLSQLDGIGWSDGIKGIAAINLADILDAPLLRSKDRIPAPL
ncbi:hypothetical protein HPB48_002122 [Haemaphysalis longicornis]|uniref:ATPase AAA-type core domain-containing protein n=1 Tax=Haemaphysalis longicornis TaxID=44386 RepID=A0A9J6FI89_HAELO|nr:hypothetical protein HPB48_002122 [Haemaphysalis longicornis]